MTNNKIRYIAFAIFMASIVGGCVKSEEQSSSVGAGNIVEVSFVANTEADSRAIINDGYETGIFKGAWEKDDRLSVMASLNDIIEHLVLSFDIESHLFKGSMLEGLGHRTYRAFYPSCGETASIPFGRERSQSGNTFNSEYDAMVSPLITIENALAGKDDNGNGITFDMQRLTSIIAASFKTSEATVANEKVKAIILSGDRPISATTLDIDAENSSASLGEDNQSSHIAVIFDSATAPVASESRAFFNIPANDYQVLSFDIVTENHTSTVSINRAGKTIEAGKLYHLNSNIAQWHEITAPSAIWDGNETFSPIEIEDDMTGKCTLDISAPAGIRKMNISIDSPILTSELLEDIGLSTEMDLIDDVSYATVLKEMGLTTGDALVNCRSIKFNLESLIPMIKMISGDTGSSNNFSIYITDFSGRTLDCTMTFTCNTTKSDFSISYNEDADLWLNTATLTANIGNSTSNDITIEYKRTDSDVWIPAEHTHDNIYKIAPEVVEIDATDEKLAYKSMVSGTGVFTGNTYDVRMTVDGVVVATSTFNAGGTKDLIQDASMDNWSSVTVTGSMFTKGSVSYPNTSSSNIFWSNGNNKNTKTLCSSSDIEGHNGTACALLKCNLATGGIFAPGNLFTGTMEFGTSVFDMYGWARFGQKFSFSGRPSALKVRFKATISVMDKKGSNDNDADHILNQTIDPARIMFCITDWTSRHGVKSGASADTSTFWNPEKASSLAEGAIIGYGAYNITESTAAGINGADENGWVELQIPVCWYDTVAKPDANNYSIVISAASSAYGDYLTGSTKNELYIEDFEWVY